MPLVYSMVYLSALAGLFVVVSQRTGCKAVPRTVVRLAKRKRSVHRAGLLAALCFCLAVHRYTAIRQSLLAHGIRVSENLGR